MKATALGAGLLSSLALACGNAGTPPSEPEAVASEEIAREVAPPAAAPERPAGWLDREQTLGPFLSAHWQIPVPAQGPVPAGWEPAEASLAPEVCGACHPQQLADWKQSFHAGAYSPGLAGQLIEGSLSEPGATRQCLSCHSPLEEQQATDAAGAESALFDPELRAQGLVCAGCHVRAHMRLGPPRRAELPSVDGPLPHGGFDARPEFQDARFCAPCHQFFDEAGIAGKPVENTFAEWRASPQAAEGRTCQSCHMPDRRHLWRGIHDPEMVRGAVDTGLFFYPPDPADEAQASSSTPAPLRADFVLRNTDVGHMFPSYVTPRVLLAVWQMDDADVELPGTRQEIELRREVDFGSDSERRDTRVAPGQSVKLEYAADRHAEAVALGAAATVDPDHHYRGVYSYLLSVYEDPEARRLITEALRAAEASSFELRAHRADLPSP